VPLAALMLVLAAAVTAAASTAAPATASTTAARPTAGKAPLKDLIGQPVKHVTAPAAAKAKAQAAAISRPAPASAARASADRAATAHAKPGNSAAAAAAAAAGYSPAQLQQAYNLTSSSTSPTGGMSGGAPETVAVISAYDDPTAAADLAAYRAGEGLTDTSAACAADGNIGSGCVKTVNENNQASPLPATAPTTGTDWTWEDSLSIDAVTAICPNCQILLVEGDSASLGDLGQAAITAENDADFITGDWVTAEFPGETADDQAYFNAPGKAVVFPAGAAALGSRWPASSQYVTAVGGTTLTADSSTSRGYTETAWSSTGSGCSAFEPKPSWQTDTGCPNRTGNDVSADADPTTGTAVYDSTAHGTSRTAGWGVGGGDALAAAIITGAYALNGLPQAGTYPASYPYQSGASGGFNDVTSGSNGTCESNRQYLCSGVSGYDGPTGEGTPNGISGLAYSSSGDTVTVDNPGNQAMGWSQVSPRIPMQATDSDASQAITWTATGLPEQLTINSATGVISGDLDPTDGDRKITATATDASGASGSVTFDLSVISPLRSSWTNQPGPVTSSVSGMCIDDPSGTTTAGTAIHVFACNGNVSQNWSYYPPDTPGSTGNGGEIILNADVSRCLAIPGTNSGSKATIQACDRTDPKQEWNLQSSGEFYNPLSGRCLSDPGNSSTNNTQLDIENCTGATGQQWSPPAAEILSGIKGDCMDDYQQATANNTKVDLYTCNDGPGQKWAVNPDGTIKIQGTCLDMQSNSTLNGGDAELFTCNGGKNQQWSVLPDGELMNANSGKCLDDNGNSTTLGTQLVQEDCARQAGQVWEPA